MDGNSCKVVFEMQSPTACLLMYGQCSVGVGPKKNLTKPISPGPNYPGHPMIPVRYLTSGGGSRM